MDSHQAPMSGHWINSRLGEPWDAPAFGMASKLNREVLEALLERWVSASNVLEPLVRLGLVLCTPFLRPQLRAALAPELSRLMQCATEDDDPWVRVVARALGSSSGRTDLDAVVADLPLVGDTLQSLRSRLAEASPVARDFRPLEEAWLSQTLRAQAGAPVPTPRTAHGHFSPPQSAAFRPSAASASVRAGGGGGARAGEKRKMQTLDMEEVSKLVKLKREDTAPVEAVDDLGKVYAAERERLKQVVREREKEKRQSEEARRRSELLKKREEEAEVRRLGHLKFQQQQQQRKEREQAVAAQALLTARPPQPPKQPLLSPQQLQQAQAIQAARLLLQQQQHARLLLQQQHTAAELQASRAMLPSAQPQSQPQPAPAPRPVHILPGKVIQQGAVQPGGFAMLPGAPAPQLQQTLGSMSALLAAVGTTPPSAAAPPLTAPPRTTTT